MKLHMQEVNFSRHLSTQTPWQGEKIVTHLAGHVESQVYVRTYQSETL